MVKKELQCEHLNSFLIRTSTDVFPRVAVLLEHANGSEKVD